MKTGGAVGGSVGAGVPFGFGVVIGISIRKKVLKIAIFENQNCKQKEFSGSIFGYRQMDSPRWVFIVCTQ